MIDISIPIKPLSVNQWKTPIPRGKYCTSIKTAAYRQFEKDIDVLLPVKDKIEGEVSVTIEFHMKQRYTNSDVDNYAKPLIDCLERKGYFENDNKIQSLNLSKYKSNEWNIRVIITEA